MYQFSGPSLVNSHSHDILTSLCWSFCLFPMPVHVPCPCVCSLYYHAIVLVFEPYAYAVFLALC